MNLSNRNKTMLILAAALFVVIVVLIFTTIFGIKYRSISEWHCLDLKRKKSIALSNP